MFTTPKSDTSKWRYVLALGVLAFVFAVLLVVSNLNVLHVNAQTGTTPLIPLSQSIANLVGQGNEVSIQTTTSFLINSNGTPITRLAIASKSSDKDYQFRSYGSDFICVSADDKPTSPIYCIPSSNISGSWYTSVTEKPK